MNFSIVFLFWMVFFFNFCGVLIGIELQLYIAEADIEILTVVNLIHEDGICVIHFI